MLAPRRHDEGHGETRSGIAVVRTGGGPEVLLVHGGAGPSMTWTGLASLATRWTLAYAYRRGSPPGRHDFDADADDLEPLLRGRPHVVAHCYGTLRSLLAAARRPDLIRSPAPIGPPASSPRPWRPRGRTSPTARQAMWRDGLDAEPAILREFLPLAAVPNVDDAPLPEAAPRGVGRAHGAAHRAGPHHR